MKSSEDGVRLISSWVGGALCDFYDNDRDLLDYSAGEWSCVFRIGVYLEQRVDPVWRVDIEYDRQGVGGNQKALGRMRPDVVLHKRGSTAREDNLLFLEIKRLWLPGADCDDLAKIRKVVSGELGFQYQFAAAIGLCVGGRSGRHFKPTWTLLTTGAVVAEDECISMPRTV